MTPEERAELLAATWGLSFTVRDSIRNAIRQAENDALERAAGKARESGAPAIAFLIRALKHPD